MNPKLRTLSGISFAQYPRAQRKGDAGDRYYFEFTSADGAVIAERTMLRRVWHEWQKRIAAEECAATHANR